MTKRIALSFVCQLFLCFSLYAQNSSNNLEEILNTYFQRYSVTDYSPKEPYKMLRFSVNEEKRSIDIYGNETFASQPLTPDVVRSIYSNLKLRLPAPYNTYQLTIYGNDKLIEDLIPNIYREDADKSRLWGNINYTGEPWVRNISRAYTVTDGLQNRHISLWASHGRYYKNDHNMWVWQRPYLYCTTEDLFTQTFVVPYLMPMLQNAGAIVFSPRERDWQKNEVIVDNDIPQKDGFYEERISLLPWETTPDSGFANRKTIYFDKENPFTMGTARQAATTTKRSKASLCTWTPNIPEDGEYAVYVSYRSLPNSVSDAVYTVYNKGGITRFQVNQQMGGGTWVYLGTFRFDKGTNRENRVTLSNESNYRGVITADAVRFGGGMGNIARGGQLGQEIISGYPRFLEGARYYAQWAGMGYDIYSSKNGENDYGDDINSRSLMTNFLGTGSVYIPGFNGQRVPFELSLAVHSDAGFCKPQGIYGTLGICTTANVDGVKVFNSGMSRNSSYDFANSLLTTIQKDMTAYCGIPWTRRELFDRNYSETRLPEIPSAILEMFSHQNFTDMKYGHDPNFKFMFSRAIYKTILKYINFEHGKKNYTVQPLPVKNFSAELFEENMVELNWNAVKDSLEDTANPTGYIVYTREGNNNFDNGVYIPNQTTYRRIISNDVIYSFKVTAVNQGGESFPSETLSAMRASGNPRTILIINGFHRLSSPAVIETPDSLGFDIRKDPGVPYMKTAGFSGYQQCFDRKTEGKEGPGGLGYSGKELEGSIIAGNTFDYPYIHGEAIKALPGYSFVSCSSEVIENGKINLEDYPMVDLILGLEKETPYGIIKYKTFSPIMQDLLSKYCYMGGRLFVSGSYLGSDMSTYKEKNFTETVLKYTAGGSMHNDSTGIVQGLKLEIPYSYQLNEKQYAVTSPDRILPTDKAFTAFIYSDGTSAGIAYENKKYRVLALGFPFESISDSLIRKKVMASVIHFLVIK